MKTTTLLFWGIEDADLIKALYASDSGFEIDARQPLRSDFGNAIAIVGVVVNAAQLALTIYLLKNSKKVENPGMEVRMAIERPDGTVLRIEGKNVGDIQTTLE